MRFRLIRLRFRKRFRKSQRQVEEFSTQTEQSIETLIFNRFERLRPVRRFVISWLLLVVLLIGVVLAQTVMLSGYFQTYQPVPGGVYTEGVMGRFTTANPLFATNPVDSTVSRLVFSGLFTYDGQNRLASELAQSFSVDEHGTLYTVRLKPHLQWQDGQPLTASDVVFTYQTIQNPDVQSPLLSSWQGITVAAPDPTTITFKLPNVLASFPYTLTNGIVPQHLLTKILPSDLRTADFNTLHPVGAGPFRWQAIEVTGNDPATQKEQIALVPSTHYQGGTPKLQALIVKAYSSEKQLAQDFQTHQLTAAEGLNAVTPQIAKSKSIVQHTLLLSAATMVFFKTSTGQLSDTAVRQALTSGTNQAAILASLGYPTRAVKEPFLQGQVGYDPSLEQAGFNLKTANDTLDQAGWAVSQNGFRTKDGKQLSFTLTASDTPEYRNVCKLLAQQWRAIGVNLHVQFQDASNFQSTLASHDYDAVLYGISIGVDPDVYVYWDSSQADLRAANRLNLSEYKNATADVALEAGRTRLAAPLRAIKYRPFLQAWQHDAPAVGLYQPRSLYLTNGAVAGFTDHTINSSADRFYNVQNWEIRQARVTNQ